MRRLLLFILTALLSSLALPGCSSSPSSSARDDSAIIITRQSVIFSQRTFEPAAPSADMPPLGEGEQAECDSNFLSNASLTGQPHKIDSTSALVTITQVKITLQLRITVWVPKDATSHVIEHEQGHRQISEHYYESAGLIAHQIAASYLGRQLSVSGPDLSAATSKALLKLSSDITTEYNERMTPSPAQQRYDDLTDHSRNDVSAASAVARALEETAAP